MSTKILGLGELGASRNPDDILTALGLGSCVGVVFMSAGHQFAAMAHVVLPGDAAPGEPPRPPAYYANRAVARLLGTLGECGIPKHAITVKLVGGGGRNVGSGSDIGRRNVLCLKRLLWRHGLTPAAEDVGGSVPRTVEVRPGRPDIRVTSPNHKELLL